MSGSYATQNVLVTMGDDFNYQDAGMWFTNLDKLIEYTNLKAAKDGLNMKLFYSTPDCYLKAVRDAKPVLPTKQDDFFPYASDPHAYWTGYFTSRSNTKYFEREGNNYLQMAKQLQVLAGLEEHNKFVLNELKSAMGVMQHHDAITGTEKEHVTHDYERMLDQAIEDSLIVPRQALQKFMQGPLTPSLLVYNRCRLNESSCAVSENSQQFVVTVYNHLAWELKEVIRIPVLEGNYDVTAPNGEVIKSQLVDIPTAVLSIPTRSSKATHEIVFIAYLHPLSYKSYYIKKTNTNTQKKFKRNTNPFEEKRIKNSNKKSEFHISINDYWKKIRDRPLYEMKNMETNNLVGYNYRTDFNRYDDVIVITPKKPIYDGLDVNDKVEAGGTVDVDVLRGGGDSDVLELTRIIKEAKGEADSETTTKAREVFDRKLLFPSLTSDEMRMLSDDPLLVQRYVDGYIENQFLKIRYNDSGISSIFLPDGTQMKFNIEYAYYPGAVGNNEVPQNRSSGAYIFRPSSSTDIPIHASITKGPMGDVVKELRLTYKENVDSFIRVYDELNFIENEWIVGPIYIEDDIGKEFIVKYVTDILNNGEFYTDSNGRQMLKRKLNKRPQFNATIVEPIGGNYYPITNKIFISDENKLAVLTDRSEGGSSLQEGEIEVMLHRRLLHDDAFGVDEALNETANGKGLVVRGRHRIFASKPNDKNNNVLEKKLTLQFHLQPQVFVSDAQDVSLEEWLKFTKAFSWVNAVPDGLHLLTIEPISDKKMLLRLENYLELNDKADSTIEIDITTIFKTLTIKNFKETNLAGNIWMEDIDKWYWDTDNQFSDSFNKNYGSFGDVDEAKELPETQDDGFKIKIKAKQIRTFVVDYELNK